MAEILGLGLTHYPLLAGTDEHMADLLRWTLRDPDIPAAEKDPANWPALMRREWADDGGTRRPRAPPRGAAREPGPVPRRARRVPARRRGRLGR